MEILNNANTITAFLIALGSIFATVVTAFLIIRSQLVKVLKAEAQAWKDRADRIQKDLDDLHIVVEAIKKENEKLLEERDYLRKLIMDSLTSSTTIHKKILRETVEKLDLMKKIK